MLKIIKLIDSILCFSVYQLSLLSKSFFDLITIYVSTMGLLRRLHGKESQIDQMSHWEVSPEIKKEMMEEYLYLIKRKRERVGEERTEEGRGSGGDQSEGSRWGIGRSW